VVIKGFRPIMLVKNAVIIYIINLQYISITGVIDINYRYYSYKVQNRRSNALFFFFFYLPLYTLFFLNFFLKLR